MAEERIIPTQATTDLPSFVVLADGEELSQEIAIHTITVERSVNKIPTATIEFFDGSVADENFELSAGEQFIPGVELEIQAGYNNLVDPIFKGIIVKHGIQTLTDEPSRLVVELKDIAVKMTVGRKNRYFDEDSLDSDIMETILGDYDVEPDVEATEVEHKEMVQYFISDWDFLLARAEANGKLVFIDDGAISIKAPDLSAEPLLNLFYGHNVFEFDATMDARDQLAATKSNSWDFTGQEVSELEGADPGLEETGNLSATDLADVIGLETWPLQHSGKLTEPELQAWADNKLMRSRLAKVRGRVRIVGFSDIKPGDIIELGGFGDRFNGKAFVSGVLHQITEGVPWYTDLTVGMDPCPYPKKYTDIIEEPAGGLVAPMDGIQYGVVTNIHEDPDGEFRVKVRIPIIDVENEGVWARVATLDAGDGRGTFFRPEVDDEVIVGFVNNDPRDPVILGMVHSSAKPSPIEPAEENNEKGIITRGEIKLLFDDDKIAVTIETPNGNKAVLSDDDGGITLEDENGNKIIMNSDGITIESAADINMKASGDINIEGANLNQKASQAFKAEGSSGAELSTSAQAVIKGGTVAIN
ncbi:MAG: type VI secretion system tip protein VgrG [Bacteroidota bacterium]